MPIYDDFLKLASDIDTCIDMPRIDKVLVSNPEKTTHKSSKFGALILEDGTVGLTYTDLDQASQEIQKLGVSQFIGKKLIDVSRLCIGTHAWERVMGMAAINAFSQKLLQSSQYLLADNADTLDVLSPGAEDHIGMVGYFPPLVDQIRELGNQLTVIELDPSKIQETESFRVTADTRALSQCDKVLCTGTTLVNHTIEDVLQHTSRASDIHLIGPTVGCLPDSLFEAGITAVGGRQILDSVAFEQLWHSGQPWRAISRRYTIRSDSYPGFRELLKICT